MLTGLAIAAMVGFVLGLRTRAAMLLMSSMLVVLAGCAAEWNALLAADEAFWAMMRIWLYLAAHQFGFVAGSCDNFARAPSAEPNAGGDGFEYGSRGSRVTRR